VLEVRQLSRSVDLHEVIMKQSLSKEVFRLTDPWNEAAGRDHRSLSGG